MDKLEIKKTWDDEKEDFCEIEISAQNDNISAKSRFYVTYNALIELSNKLENLYLFKSKNAEWEFSHSCEGNGKLIFEVNDCYHIVYEVIFNIGNDYSCNFFIEISDFEALKALSNSLKSMAKKDI